MPFEYAILVGFVVALAMGSGLLLTVMLVRRKTTIDADALDRFARLGLQHAALRQRMFLYGDYGGAWVVVTWYYAQRGMKTEPYLLLHAKVRGTANLKLHLATKLRGLGPATADAASMLGWFEEGPFMVAQGHEMHIEEERKIIERFSKETVEWITSTERFPEGITLRSSYFMLMYGAAAAKTLAGGDADLAMDLDIQTRMPFYASDAQVLEELDNLAEAAKLLSRDLA